MVDNSNLKIKFLVVGCGYIGKRHIEMILSNDEAELVGVVDVREQKDLDASNLKVPFFKTLDDFFESGIKVDVINIATPNGFHYEHSLRSLKERKHIVVEKPLALSKLDAEKIIHESLNVNCYVFAVMQNRYSPPSIWIKELVESNKLGKIYMVLLNCFWNRDSNYYSPSSWHGKLDLDGGTLFTQFSHFVDILYWLFGDIKNIQGKFQDFNHQELTDFEDSGIVSFEFLSGGIGSLNYSTSVWQQNMESSMTIIAENGSVKIGGQYMNEVVYCNIKNYEMPKLAPTNPGNDYGTYKGSAQNHQYVINNVIDVIKGRAPITTNAMEGLKVVDIIERIYKHK